jgi:hypothetical protein
MIQCLPIVQNTIAPADTLREGATIDKSTPRSAHLKKKAERPKGGQK